MNYQENDKNQTSSPNTGDKKNKKGPKSKSDCPSGVGKNDNQFDA